MAVKLLFVSGTRREPSRTRALARAILDEAREAGADCRLHDLHELVLPLFRSNDPEQAGLEAVRRVKADAEWADAFLLGTPEYHGCLSSTLKNWFDFLYEELSGKLAGFYAVAGGGSGDMSITTAKNNFHWCHGFTLPFHAAARGADFDGTRLGNDSVRQRLTRILHDLIRYAPPLRQAFEAARAEGKAPESGFAGLHAP
jgi:NAD(P)H-dependent FMN reductase